MDIASEQGSRAEGMMMAFGLGLIALAIVCGSMVIAEAIERLKK